MEENVPVEVEKVSDTEETAVETNNNGLSDTEEIKAETNNNDVSKAPKQSKKKGIRDAFDMLEAVVIAIVASLFILTLLFRVGYVSGDSMLTTMHDGDRYIVSNLFYTPERGDIIVFEPDLKLPSGQEKLYVKRVIGIEGDHIEIRKNAQGVYQVIINGQVQKEEYLDSHQRTEPHLKNTQFDENGDRFLDITVPKGHIFVMGDNRINSQDSRDLGCIDTRRIVGKILLRFFPFQKFGPVA